MREVVSPTDLNQMTWIRFYHLYETHSANIEKQVQNLERNGK
jgi:hypothetical protein